MPSSTKPMIPVVELNPVPTRVPMLNPCKTGVERRSGPESKVNRRFTARCFCVSMFQSSMMSPERPDMGCPSLSSMRLLLESSTSTVSVAEKRSLLREKKPVAVGVVLATQGRRQEVSHRHGGALWQKIAETEVVNVPTRHVVVEVHLRSCRMHHDEAKLDIISHVVVEVDGEGVPTGRVLSCRGTTGEAVLPTC